MRQTSAEIYDQISKSGVLSKRRLLVYKVLAIKHAQVINLQIGSDHFGMTAHEMRDYAEKFLNVTQKIAEHLPKRLSELENSGCVDNIGTRKCRITGNNAIVWDINGELPNPKLMEVKSKRWERKEKAMKALDALIYNYDNNIELKHYDFVEIQKLIAEI